MPESESSDPERVRVTRLGGAGFRLETRRGIALIDPPELEPASLVLLTASTVPPWFEAAAAAGPLLGPPALRSAARVRGVDLEPIDIGGEWNGAFGRVRACDTAHRGDRGFGFLVTSAGFSIYHAGRTGLTYEMSWLADLHRIDGVLLPIEGRSTMGPREAAQAAAWLRARWVVGWDPNRPAPSELAEVELSEHLAQWNEAKLIALGRGEAFDWPPLANSKDEGAESR